MTVQIRVLRPFADGLKEVYIKTIQIDSKSAFSFEALLRAFRILYPNHTVEFSIIY